MVQEHGGYILLSTLHSSTYISTFVQSDQHLEFAESDWKKLFSFVYLDKVSLFHWTPLEGPDSDVPHLLVIFDHFSRTKGRKSSMLILSFSSSQRFPQQVQSLKILDKAQRRGNGLCGLQGPNTPTLGSGLSLQAPTQTFRCTAVPSLVKVDTNDRPTLSGGPATALLLRDGRSTK